MYPKRGTYQFFRCWVETGSPSSSATSYSGRSGIPAQPVTGPAIGSGSGPRPKFRAYVAAHSVAWRPGVTRRRHPRNQSVHLWSSDPAHYPVLTAADRRRLAFGSQDKKNRTRANQDAAWEDLAGVEILTRTATTQDGRRGWLIVPEAAAAIQGPAQPENLTCATGEQRSRKSLRHNNRTPSPPRPRLRQEEGGGRRRSALLPKGSPARRRHSLSLSKTGFTAEHRTTAKERVL